MSQNIVIGLGAAGAKAVRAALQLTACGAGPDHLTIGFVEQDPLAPDLKDALEFADAVAALRAALHDRPNAAHHVSPRCPLARAEIDRLGDPAVPVWRPAGASGGSVFDALGLFETGGAADALMQTLFTTSEEDWRARQMRGFGGDAHLAALAVRLAGAAAIAPQGVHDAFWSALMARIASGTAQTPVRIVLAGALYEPLGACSLELARLIMEAAAAAGTHEWVDVSCLWLGPSAVTADMTAEARRAQHARFRATLTHHARQLEHELLVARVYLLGWDPAFVAKARSNAHPDHHDATPTDLLAGAAIAGHYDEPFMAAGQAAADVRISERTAASALVWRDVDAAWSETPAAHRVSGPAIQTLLFALHWRSFYGPRLRQQARRAVLRDDWFKACCPKIRMIPEQEAGDYIDQIDAYTEKFLSWTGEIGAAADGGLQDFHLWRNDRLAAAASDADIPSDDVIPKAGGAGVSGRAPQAVRDQLRTGTPPAGAAGLGGLVEALFNAGIDAGSSANLLVEAS